MENISRDDAYKILSKMLFRIFHENEIVCRNILIADMKYRETGDTSQILHFAEQLVEQINGLIKVVKQ